MPALRNIAVVSVCLRSGVGISDLGEDPHVLAAHELIGWAGLDLEQQII